MSKVIKLLTAAWAAGRTRNPDEGLLHLEDKEAQRLLDDEAGVDVTKDFTAAELKDWPVMPMTHSEPEPPVGDPEPHQSATAVEDAPKPKPAKG